MAKQQVTPYQPSEKSQEALMQFFKECVQSASSNYNIRERLLEADRAYMRENDRTEDTWKSKQAKKVRGDITKFQNKTIPVVLPQVESAVTYQVAAFCSGYPMFGVVSFPEFEDEAQQMDTIIGEQQIKGKWINEFIKLFRMGFKYNLAFMEVVWQQEKMYQLTTDSSRGTDGQLTEVKWEGNKLKCLDMYNTFWDTRCKISELPEHGEFIGYNEPMTRIHLKKFLDSLSVKMNVKEALESAGPGDVHNSAAGESEYYTPFLNPAALVDLTNSMSQGTNWLAWAGISDASQRIQYKNQYLVTTLYGRILPSDFKLIGVPAPNTPQIWKFIIVNGQILVHCERMTNAHNLLPVLPYQPLDDGLDYQTKSLATNVEPIQDITSAFANSSIASRRRGLSDRMLFDPSRVSPGALNNDNPSAKIPVRPSAYQDDLSKAVYPFPFRDDQYQTNQMEIQAYLGMANQITGYNNARQGQFQKGNKTRTEFQETMQYANGRDQAIALSTESTFFTPLKEILKINILQYQPDVKLYNRETQEGVEVDPVALRKAQLVFTMSDGLLPNDKLLDGESLQLAMQTLMSVPELAQAYNVAPMFSYLMKMRGAKLQPFEKSPEQLAYEQALAQWQQAAMQIAAAIQEAAKETEPKMSPEQLQELVESLTQQNPMPQAEEYGYDPAKPTLSQSSPMNPERSTILQSLTEKSGQAAQASQGARGAAQPQIGAAE